VPVLLNAVIHAEKCLRILAEDSSEGDGEYQDDPSLNRTLEGSVLINQCLIASALEETPQDHERELQAVGPTLLTLRNCNEKGKGVIESLIGKKNSSNDVAT
jgi:hypothetical protein